MLLVLNPGDRLGIPFSAVPGTRFGYTDHGVPGWTLPIPHPHDGAQWAEENGARGNAALYALTASGAGGGHTTISVSGIVNGAGELSTGTTTTGRAHSSHQAGASSLVLDAASGMILYDAIVAIPTLPDGTQTFGVAVGLLDVANNVDQTDGCYFRLTTASANFQAITSSNSTRTTTDTGFAPSAGQFYRLKIVAINATEVRFYISTQSINCTADMTLVATNTTNIPTGAGREMGAGLGIVKTAGTTARTLRYQYQRVQRRKIRSDGGGVIGSGFGALNPGDSFNGKSDVGAGMQGAKLRIVDQLEQDRTETPIWNERAPTDPYPFLGMACGVHGQDFLAFTLNSGSAGVVASDGWFGEHNLSSATSATAEAALRIANLDHLVFDANSNRLVFEATFTFPNLSDGTQTFQVYFGFRSIDGADGAFFRTTTTGGGIEAVTRAAGVETATATITLVANTSYWLRIVATNNSNVKFYIDVLGNELEDTTAATHNTNIPTADFTVGSHLVKTVGTTARQCRLRSQLAYQRRNAAIGVAG